MPPTLLNRMPFAADLEKLGRRLDDLVAPPSQTAAVELAAERITVARQAGESGGGVRAAARGLEPGAIQPSAVQVNLPDAAGVAGQLRPLLDALGLAGAEVALLVPDLTARVSVLEFDSLPARRDEIESLVRFRLRKSLPFAEDKAVISSQLLPKSAADEPARLLVALAERSRLDEYEDCLEAAGARAAVVLPSGLTCLAAMPALEQGGLLIRSEPGSLTTAFCRQGRVEFFRVIELEAAASFDDVFPSVAYFRDHCEKYAPAALQEPGSLALLTAGMGEELAERLREELPWATVRPAEVTAAAWAGGEAGGGTLLACAGALRGRFA